MPDTATIPRVLASLSVLLLAGTFLGACEQTAGISPTSGPMLSDVGAAPALPQFNDILVPQGAKLLVERTIIVGENPWYGQLALGSSGDPPALFEQYRRDMSALGWQELASIRAATSIITFMREGRVATVQIQAARLRGSEILITVSPRGSGSAGAAPSRGSLRPGPVQRGQ